MAENFRPPQERGATLTTVKFTPPPTLENPKPQDKVLRNVICDSTGLIMVSSQRAPEEVMLFGLTLDESCGFICGTEVQAVWPAARGIERSRDDGLCIYCQLLLLPEPPEHTVHRPSFQCLMDFIDTCLLCKLISISLAMACPELKQMYYDGYPALYDRSDTSTRITIVNTRFDTHMQIIACCGDPGTSKFRGRPLVWSTGQNLGSLKSRRIWNNCAIREPERRGERFDLLSEWIQECRETHDHCDNDLEEELPQLPARVLEISPGDWQEPQNGQDPFIVRLLAPSSDRGRYVALSHCWGASVPLRTLRSNLATHQQGIPFFDMPLTFQDAVLWTYSTGCRYLWIDSLCIVQDDADEWVVEAAKMASVYSDAFFTIAATSAVDDSEGTQYEYNSAFVIPVDGDEAFIRLADHFNLDSEQAPLNMRGWTFQEAVLSKRMICFTKDQLLWKCRTKHQSEDGLLNAEDASLNTEGSLWNIQASLRKLDTDQSRYDLWYRMMEVYSKRKLQFEKDKLAALAGIVEEFQRAIGDSPAMGIWADDMLRGLMWKAREMTEGIECAPPETLRSSTSKSTGRVVR